ncbi:PREDICTED: flavin-containing monooxygenase FMO GS-OX-like 9 [Fragaria vesca subsp. vesca]|uniref:flavin-containing monooxygenase FMO GS-OX-like 9 n=1 Tax=Fragaria vesca subsp. vesca TaxID=101020 RepID=UPI0002C3501B|nr:PREDICTED: flavin-containing monooxygenase FMO GS-OX-like 9 [Fragaria vesca subsp. vesca]
METTTMCESYQSKSVCVIGAGPSGLVAARELKKEGHRVVVLEQNHDVGGQWLYDPNVEGEDPLGRNTTSLTTTHNSHHKVHSSVYTSLRLGSPREIMAFTDFPFSVKKGRDSRRFPGHRELLLYLQDFCDWFGLRDFIRFNNKVAYVGMLDHVEGCQDLRWLVKSVEKNTQIVMEEVFNSVVVATGHQYQPRLPSIKGMDSWKRKQLHSHIYRVPEPFRDEVVVVVGTAQSGQDISVELVQEAKAVVYLSARSLSNIFEGLSKVISKHDNLHLRPQIECLQQDGKVLFVDGSWVIADTIIYCTGYSYTFPFLDTKGIVAIDDDRVGPLFEHTFPPSLAPSLSFIGIPRKVIAFHFFESQAKWIAQVLSGKRKLPSRDEMMQSIKDFYHSRDVAGIPKYQTHDIGEFEYCDKYADYTGFPHLEEWKKKIFFIILNNYFTNLETYRDSLDDDDLIKEALQSPHFIEQEQDAQVSPL